MNPMHKCILEQVNYDLLISSHRLYEAMKWQIEMPMAKYGNQVSELFSRIKQTAKANCAELEAYMKTLDSNPPAGSQKANPWLDANHTRSFYQSQPHPLSLMLRDDYSEISGMTIAYTMLHSVGIAIHDGAGATIALRHLELLTPLLAQIIKILPHLVTQELNLELPDVDVTGAMQAQLNTQRAWSASYVMSKRNGSTGIQGVNVDPTSGRWRNCLEFTHNGYRHLPEVLSTP